MVFTHARFLNKENKKRVCSLKRLIDDGKIFKGAKRPFLSHLKRG